MIKFFRNIRRRLLRENRFTRYLLYAVGEIILVVIGILIALQVNNWNQEKSQRAKELTYLTEIYRNLEYDYKNEILLGIKDYKQNDKAYAQFLIEIKNYPDSTSVDTLAKLLVDWIIPWKFQINYSAINNLESVGVDLISCDSLRNQVSKLYGYDFPYALDFNTNHHDWVEKNIWDLLNSNINMNGDDWTNEQILFLKSDFQARNRFNINKVYYMDNMIAVMEDLKKQSEIVMQHLEKEIGNLDDDF